MNIADLKLRIAQIAHRTDLGPQLDNFIADALDRINRRFGVALALPSGTDPLPEGTDLLWLYASLVSCYTFLNNGDNARSYDAAWELEADRQNVLNPGTVLDNYEAAAPNMGY